MVDSGWFWGIYYGISRGTIKVCASQMINPSSCTEEWVWGLICQSAS
jgi:hypothetical protein